MRVLYLPNEPVVGWQVGARDALQRLHERGVLDQLTIYSFLQYPPAIALAKILDLARELKPDVVLFTKLAEFPVDDAWLLKLKTLAPRPCIVYYDGDVYGRIFKRITPSTRAMCRHADYVFLCGLGDVAKIFEEAGARNIRYLPHNASSRQFGADWVPTADRELDVVVVGNRVRGRFRLQDRVPCARMPGAYLREQLVRLLGKVFRTRFAVYGRGWEGFVGDRGPLAFDRQHEVLRRSWLSVGYDHFPDTPFYFSDRLPIALLSGVAHVVHFHPGYETLFGNGRELLWAHSLEEIIETVGHALGRGPRFLNELGARGREFAARRLASEVVYGEMIDAVSAGARNG